MAKLEFILIDGPKKEFKKIELIDSDLRTLKAARCKLQSILKLEELYDLIIDSFLEFKTQLYSNSLLFPVSTDIRESHDIRSKLNRQLFNTLNLTKLYLDKHVYNQEENSFVKKMTKDITLHQKVLDLRHKIKEENSNYMLGCELRNYVQHSTLPIGTFTREIDSNIDNKNTLPSMRFYLPLIKDRLKKNGANSKLLNLIKQNDDIHKTMDGYIHAISVMHMQNRKLTSQVIKLALNSFQQQVEKIEKEFGMNHLGISMVENNKVSFTLDLDWFELVLYLQKKHSSIINSRNFEHII